ncbi:hypothetical protein AB0G54_13270 [Streptomyces yokosukanensis]|nr:hypothetical protein [Streptomyces yokosukanensis]
MTTTSPEAVVAAAMSAPKKPGKVREFALTAPDRRTALDAPAS